jgi:hypothetical protein
LPRSATEAAAMRAFMPERAMLGLLILLLTAVIVAALVAATIILR